MFWIWFEWQVFTEPYNLKDDGDTIKLNPLSMDMWVNMPPLYQGVATTLSVIMEG